METFIFGVIVGLLIGLAFGGAIGIRMTKKEKNDDFNLRDWWGS